MLKVWTAQMRYPGKDRLDITVKSGTQAFAPSWPMVIGFKDGSIDEEGYTWRYKNLMEKSKQVFFAQWEDLLKREEVTLVCYCPAGAFCHRILLAKMLEEQFGVQYMGERSLT